MAQANSDESLFNRLARGMGIKTVRDTFHSECDTLRDEIDLRCKLNKELFLELHELNMGWVRDRCPCVCYVVVFTLEFDVVCMFVRLGSHAVLIHMERPDVQHPWLRV